MTTHVARCAARLWLTAIALSVHRTQTKKRHGNRGAGRKNVFHWMTFHVSGHHKTGSHLRLYANEPRAPIRTEAQPNQHVTHAQKTGTAFSIQVGQGVDEPVPGCRVGYPQVYPAFQGITLALTAPALRRASNETVELCAAISPCPGSGAQFAWLPANEKRGDRRNAPVTSFQLGVPVNSLTALQKCRKRPCRRQCTWSRPRVWHHGVCLRSGRGRSGAGRSRRRGGPRQWRHR